jgi:hypothetical protein
VVSSRRRPAALMLLFICIALASIGRRMKNREWLRRAGPFEISETTLSEMTAQRDHWRVTARLEHEKVVELTERLEESDELIAQLRTAFASGSMVGGKHS